MSRALELHVLDPEQFRSINDIRRFVRDADFTSLVRAVQHLRCVEAAQDERTRGAPTLASFLLAELVELAQAAARGAPAHGVAAAAADVVVGPEDRRAFLRAFSDASAPIFMQATDYQAAVDCILPRETPLAAPVH